jgi:adenylylsulfate kinase-like enzyme
MSGGITLNLTIKEVRDRIIECRQETPRERANLVGISGIDASGKGFIAEQLADELEFAGHHVALINVDGGSIFLMSDLRNPKKHNTSTRMLSDSMTCSSAWFCL